MVISSCLNVLIVIVNDNGAILTVKQGSWLIDENDDTYIE